MVNEMGATMTWFNVTVAVLLGLIVGSAINALVWRLYVGRSWVHGRSECPECGHKLAPRDLVPVVSWLLLRGRCRYCQSPIKDSPMVELTSAVVFAISAYALPPTNLVTGMRLAFWLVALTLLLALAVYDARWMILPDKLMIPLLGVALIYSVTMALLTGDVRMVEGAAIAAIVFGGGFYALVAVSKGRAMGGGDIKLAAAMGLLLGLKAAAVAMLISFNSAAIVGIGLLMAHRRGRRDQIAFGPFLVLGTIVAMWWGHAVVSWYLRLSGLS